MKRIIGFTTSATAKKLKRWRKTLSALIPITIGITKKKIFFVQLSVLSVFVVTVFNSCEKDINIKVPQDDEKIVVEAYVNNLYANLNYVLISKTINYFNPDFKFNGFTNADVKISEGKIISPGDTSWKTYPFKSSLLPGFYNNDSISGKPGYAYKLEIVLNNEYYYGLTTIPQVVPVDSLTDSVVHKSNGFPRAFLTVHYADPPSLGQNYKAGYRFSSSPGIFAWGDIPDSTISLFPDDNINGLYQRWTYPGTFNINDTIQYYLINMDRDAYNFWSSYYSARNNGGPFATPIQLKSTVHGKNVIGSFSGFAVDQKQIIIK
jgi:hypothetical protein